MHAHTIPSPLKRPGGPFCLWVPPNAGRGGGGLQDRDREETLWGPGGVFSTPGFSFRKAWVCTHIWLTYAMDVLREGLGGGAGYGDKVLIINAYFFRPVTIGMGVDCMNKGPTLSCFL